jgi:short-subunit dehydrogenase
MNAARWGRVINVASIAGFAPGVAGNTLYPGVKGLMIRFSQALDSEYRGFGVKVTALCPGTTTSAFADEAGYAHLAPRPGFFSRPQTADHVAEAAINGNESGRVIVVPGWRNALAVAALRVLPEDLTRRVIDRFGARYLLGEER